MTLCRRCSGRLASRTDLILVSVLTMVWETNTHRKVQADDVPFPSASSRLFKDTCVFFLSGGCYTMITDDGTVQVTVSLLFCQGNLFTDFHRSDR